MASKASIGAKITLDGEKEYRQAIGNVSKSMSVLKSELNAVSAEYENNANSLEALRAKNDILTKQQKEQEEKLKLLRGALESVSSEYGENSKKAQDWQIKLNNAYAELGKINNELNQNEKYMKEAESSTDKTAKSIDEFGDKIKETKSETLKFGDVLKANLASDAIVNGIQMIADKARDLAVAMVDVVKSTASYADNILAMSTNTGISTDTLQELNYMAELTDTSLETITSTMVKNIRSMNSAKKGTEDYVNAYRELGIQITDANGNLRDSQAVFWETVDALGRMSNETERDAKAMTIFGRSAQDLNSIIAIGSDGVAEFSKEAHNMGAVLSEDTLESLGKTDDAIQRMVQQIEISKRTIGADMAPAMTEAITNITKKIDEVDEKFADFAGDSLESVVSGFLWLVDNIDVVAAGLKGVVAALITKKAADGITFAVQAYRTLTTATETATAAQTAFNVASKANVIGAIASVVIGLGTALYSYAKSNSDAAEETRKLNDETEKLLKTYKEIDAEVERNIQDRKESADATQSEYEAAKKLASSLYDLADKENKTSVEKSQMVALTKELNEMFPELSLSIDSQTGALSRQRSEVNSLIDSELELQRVKLAGANIAQIELDRINEQKVLLGYLDERSKKEKELEQIEKSLSELMTYDQRGSSYNSFSDNKKNATELRKEIKNLTEDINESNKKINTLNADYKTNMDFIGSNPIVETSASSMNQIIEQYKESMQANAEDAIEAVDDTLDEINDKYDEAGELLEKRLDKEQKAFEETQKAEVKAVEDAQDKEYKTLEKYHKKTLELIDEEYLEKMKLVNDEKYKELKKVQDQIDAIDTQQEAEDRAAKLKEEAEKRAELTTKVNTAKTVEDKMQAQEDLAKFEIDVAADRLKTERSLQKDILEEQKDSIKASYDEKIKSLEKEQEKEEAKVNTEVEKEKKNIEKRYELKTEALKREQEIEQEYFRDKQDAQKKNLSEQKELAIKTAKEIYAEDLKQYKLNNALKEDVNYDATFGYVKEQAIKDLYSGKNIGNATKILNAKTLEEMLKYYTPNTASSSTQTPTIDYTEMGKEMTKAVKNLKLTVMLNGKAVGAMVQENVNQMLK